MVRLFPRGVIAVACSLFLLGSTSIAHAQGAGTSSITGSVVDDSGAAVPNAAVVLRNEATGQVRAVVTDVRGRFAAEAMPAGSYAVEATASGFATQTLTGVVLAVGQAANVMVRLGVAAVAETLTVTADAARLDVTTTAKSTVVDRVAVENLPIRGRNFTEFAQLSPNVMQEANRGGIVVNGQRSINSNISVDGVDFNDSLQGNQRGGNDATFSFPQAAVQEFQVATSGVSAEVGRTNAGFINVVTKSGTNAYRGEMFYSNRNEKLTSKDAFGNSSRNNSQHQTGGAIGGPLRRDTVFGFAALEKNMLKIPYTVRFLTPSQPAGAAPVVVPADILNQQGGYFGENNPLVSFARIDTQLSPSTTLNIQHTYSALGGLSFNVNDAVTTRAVSSNNMLDRTGQGVKMGVTSVISHRALNELRAQWAYDDRDQRPQRALPQITITDFGILGGNSDGPIVYQARRYEVVDSFTWSPDRHTFKFGADVNISPQYMSRERFLAGLYTFTTFADYLAGRINRYQQALPSAGAKSYYEESQKEFGAYVQDTFRAGANLTIMAGLRWDGQVNPQPDNPNPKYAITSQIPNDLEMWQPRLGLTYDVGGRGNTVVRLAAGRYDSRTPGYLLQRAFTDNGVDVLTIDSRTDPSVLTYLQFPNALKSIPAGIALPINSIYAVDPNMRNPRATQASAIVERELGHNLRMTVGFTHNKTSDLQRRVDKNLFPPTVAATGNPIYPVGPSSTGGVLRPDPSVGAINVNESSAHSRYDGLSLSLNRRFVKRLQFQAHYTWAIAKDDDSNERDFNRQGVLNTYDYEADYGYSRQDIRHSGNVNVVYMPGRGFTLSSLLMARTGLPYKAVLGVDTQNDGNTVNDRPIINGRIVARNADRQPDFFNLDVRLTKSMDFAGGRRVIFSVEAFNLTRASNKGMDGDGESVFGAPTATPNPVTGYFYTNATAGRPTTAPSTDRFGGPRQVQLGVRFAF